PRPTAHRSAAHRGHRRGDGADHRVVGRTAGRGTAAGAVPTGGRHPRPLSPATTPGAPGRGPRVGLPCRTGSPTRPMVEWVGRQFRTRRTDAQQPVRWAPEIISAAGAMAPTRGRWTSPTRAAAAG